MDRVRFGRALGYGARHAAKSLVQAVDAAAAPRRASGAPVRTVAGFGPKAPGPAQANAPAPKPESDGFPPTPHAVPGGVPDASTDSFRAGQESAAAAAASRRKAQTSDLARSVWSPLARFSGAVWLQVTGCFFTLIALFLSQGLWKQRGALRLPVFSPEAEKLYLHAAAFAIFAYFAVSSFVRAHLRQRR